MLSRLVPRLSAARSVIGAARCASTYCVDPSIGLDAEKLDIQKVARDFAKKEMMPRREEWDEKEILDMDVLRKSGELGFGGLYCEEEFGGSGLTRLDASIIFEQLAAGCSSTAAMMSIHNMAAWMIDKYGSDALREKHIASMASFETMASYCLTEPDSGSDAAALRTTARKQGDYYVLNGSKAFISGAGVSKNYVTMVRHEGQPGAKGIFCLLIEDGMEGFHLGKKEKKLGWNTQPTRILTFEDCKVPISNQIGGDNQGFNIAMAGINGGRLNVASVSLGAAQAAFDGAIEHTKYRKQFGKHLSDFQWTQFKLAELATKLHSVRLMVRDAAKHLDADSPHKAAMCAMAKLHGTDTAFEIVNGALQMYGGYGMLKDYPLQQYLRDCRVHQVIEGTNEMMRLVVSRDVLHNAPWWGAN